VLVLGGRFREDSEDEMPEGKFLQRMSEKFRLPQSVQRLVFTVTIDREPEKLKFSAGDRLSDIAAAVLQVGTNVTNEGVFVCLIFYI
jgi:stress response protein SCP2